VVILDFFFLEGPGRYTRRYTYPDSADTREASVPLTFNFLLNAGTERRAGKAEMNLIQRGTTASQANRGKSVNKSITRYGDWRGYERNEWRWVWFPQNFPGVIPWNPSNASY